MDPDSLLESVRDERAKYGTPLKNAEMGQLINAVAWKHRADGWGLAAKSTGAHTKQPRTNRRISRDLLVHQPSEQMYDVLIDVAFEARPGWGGPMPMDMVFVAPVLPTGEVPGPSPKPGVYVAPNDAELADLIRRIPALLRG